ncbi:MAG: serine/threonine protein kinase [Verrucomicrobia bacterium]|nr:serine/threonine protein kinase [Verrucomicrobiota bacterium]
MASADRLIAIFNEAKARPAGAERERFLADACPGDTELKEQVHSLLQAHEGAGDFLKKTLVTSPTAPVTEKPGDTIGRYKLRETLGEGGCGVVYVAEQEEPIRRRVALKVIKLGMDTKAVVARFEAERQALPTMDHPNIAKVFDAGTTDTGRPYFVMELVRGIRITDYCDQANLNTKERLDLFIKVCQAIQHAHQKGIIHRDIKPSNILVTLHDGVPVPKVIDFGIAKATEGRLTEATVYTQLHQFIGTPAYMSPEQAEMSGLDIDTRSDIYALGVLLYELLAGSTPFDAKELMSQGIDAMRKTIREKEPLRPSTKLSQTLVAAKEVGRGTPCAPSSAESISTGGAHVGTRPASQSEEEVRASSRRLLRIKETITLLRGDLDWIVMKCLEKDRTRRYETANGLVADLKRHLNNEPVVARPPSAAYRFQKAFRRNKLIFAATTSVAAALVLGVVVSAWQAYQAQRARWIAVSAQQQESLARREAERNGQRAEQGELAARRNLYASDMKLASEAWDLGEIGRARNLLNAHQPKPNQEDLRGFEWRLLWALCRPDESVALPVETSIWDAIVLSPNGRLVVTGGRNGRLLLWDLPKREVIGPFPGHNLNLGCLAFSPDGRTLASGSGGLFAPNQPGELKLWDVESRILITNLAGHSLCLNDLAFSHDGKFLATAGADKTILVWDLATKEIAARLEGHTDEVLKLAFSPNRHLLATASRDHTAKLWEVPSGRCIKTLQGHTLKLWTLAFSDDGTMLATGSADTTAIVWNVASGELVAAYPQRTEVRSVAFSIGGKTLAVGSYGSVKLYDLQIKESTLDFKGLAGGVRWLAFAPNDKTLLGSIEFAMPTLWSIASAPKVQVERPHADATMALAVSHNGELIATGSGDFFQRHRPAEIKLWDFPSGRLLQTLTNHQADVTSLAFTPDDRLLASGSSDKTVRLWDVTSGKQADVFMEGLGEVGAVSISSDGQTLAAGPGDARVQLWDIPSRRPLPHLVHSPRVGRIAFAPMGNVLASGSYDGTVWIWDLKTGDVKQQLKHNPIIASLAFSPDGKTLAAGSTDKSIKLWDVESGREIRLFEGHQHVVNIVAFSPDGKILASGSVDSTVKLWNLAMGHEVATLRGHRDGIFALAFTRDGDTLISGSRDKTLRFWRAPSWTEIAAEEAKEKTQARRP